MAKSIDYKSAGVDITAGNEAVARIKSHVQSTFSSAVMTDVGSFGAMVDLKVLLKDYNHPVLVQSIDGVGTKMIVAGMMRKYDTIGFDLLAATCNDIIVHGARPLTFLDYIANDRLHPEIIEEIVRGIAAACRDCNVALIGGETAEMPDTYLPGEHDLVGVITGVVNKGNTISGSSIRPGDIVLGLASSGLHTNGYSLARKLFFEVGGYRVDSYLDDLEGTLGEVLLEPHRNYTHPVFTLLDHGLPVKGIAHITGGGLVENIPRILPPNCSVKIKKDSWPVPPLFTVLKKLGNINDQEMFRTFNMGIGMIIILDPVQSTAALKILEQLQIPTMKIGFVIPGTQKVKIETSL
ncbi:MAG: phosphoribosylformylglycinamidine cyclo-ligase [Fidelibacterota bacterium]